MSTESDTNVTAAEAASTLRRLDIDAKQAVIAKLLHDCACDGLLVLHPPNVRWLTAGPGPVGLFGRDEAPALFYNSHQRWLLCSAADTQRFFDDDLAGLGFQLKEWHWTTSREQMISDLVFGRKVACDQPFRDCKFTGTFFVVERRKLSMWESARMSELGSIVAHAIEATARNLEAGDTEEEIAGQVAHRLFRHGAEAVGLQISGDGRNRSHRRRGPGSDPVQRSCIVQATGRKFGLHATAARTVWLNEPTSSERAEFDAVLKWHIVHRSATKLSERVADTIAAGKTFLRLTPFEHEWRIAPAVCLTGRESSEGLFLPAAQDRWLPGWAAVWQERLGATALADTYLLREDGWSLATPPSEWPIRRIQFQGQSFEVADFLVRKE